MSLANISHLASLAQSRITSSIGVVPLLGLAVLGAVTVLSPTYQALSFIHYYFLRSSNISKYLSKDASRPAWALVTGATDGIGKATAGALANRGFNLVLHGRNEKKLQTVKADLQRQFPARSFKILVLDATSIDADQLEAAVDSIKDINLKVLINNVGGLANLDPLWQTLEEMSLVDINCIIDLNITFTTLLTRLLLPQLRQSEPALIMNVGSGSSEFPGIYSTVYSGTKAFIKTFSDALDAEAGVEGWKIESIGLIVGPVITESLEKSGMKTSLTQPGPQHFAKSILHVVGGGYRVVYPYWAHRALFAFILCLPRRSQISMLLDIGKGMRQKRKSD